jgi:hypothetical protein
VGLLDAPRLALNVELRLAKLFPQDGQFRFALFQARLYVLLKLLLPPPRFLEGQNILAGVNGGDQLVLLNPPLGANWVTWEGDPRFGAVSVVDRTACS